MFHARTFFSIRIGLDHPVFMLDTQLSDFLYFQTPRLLSAGDSRPERNKYHLIFVRQPLLPLQR
jgi:hypothetical protein